MKRYALTALTGIVFTCGMFAGLVEREVAEQGGEAAIADANALDNAANGICTGGSSPMCYPENCRDDGSCPTNNQCTGRKKCTVLEEAVGPGISRVQICKTYSLCDSSEDAMDEFLTGAERTEAFSPASTMAEDYEEKPSRPAAEQTRYATYY